MKQKMNMRLNKNQKGFDNMENIKRFTTFYEDCKDEFMEHLDGVRIYLQKNNSEFKNLQKEYTKILDSNEKLQNIFFGDKVETGLTPIECDLLYNAIELQEKMQIMTEEELYFKGGMDAYYYLKKMGIIK